MNHEGKAIVDYGRYYGIEKCAANFLKDLTHVNNS